jgi:hypothetical protein
VSQKRRKGSAGAMQAKLGGVGGACNHSIWWLDECTNVHSNRFGVPSTAGLRLWVTGIHTPFHLAYNIGERLFGVHVVNFWRALRLTLFF